MTTETTKKEIKKSIYCHTHEERRKVYRIAQSRFAYWENKFPDFPENVNAEYYFDEMGITIIRLFIELNNTWDENYKAIPPTPKETGAVKRWAHKLTGHEGERFFREQQGKFAYKFTAKHEDEHGSYDFIVLIENPSPLNCTIKKVKKEVEVFEADCSQSNQE